MFSQTVVKFFLRQYFLSVCILLSPKQTFPVLESNIWLSCASEECDYSSYGTVPPVICENCSEDKPHAKPFLQGLTETGSLMLCAKQHPVLTFIAIFYQVVQETWH